MSGLAEKALLLAVRDRLRLPTDQGGGGYKAVECNVEPDDDVPATVGQVYIAVQPGGWQQGPRHATSGGVRDKMHAVNIVIFKRISNVPSDRRDDVFLNNLQSLDSDVERITLAIDWRYEVVNVANATLLELSGKSGFNHPLVAGTVGKPELIGPEVFKATSQTDQPAGMKRVIPFGGARLIQTL